MFNILKAEYRKFFRGKLFIAVIILVIAFPLLTAALYGLVLRGLDTEMFEINAEFAFVGAFSPLDNFGFLFLIFLLIILLADFSQNTIRNKVVAGYSKNTIYLASTVFTLSISLVATTVYAFLNYLFTGLIVSFGKGDFLTVLKHWVVGMFATMAIYAFVQFVAFIFRTLGATLGIVLGTLIGTFLIYTIIAFRLSETANRIITTIVPLLQLMGAAFDEQSNIYWMILADVIFVAFFIGLGVYLNKRSDYK